MRSRHLPTILLSTLLVSCGDDGARKLTPAPTLSARELMDASEAIEKFINAERTQEAVLVARKLIERAPAGSSAAATANELAAQALFVRARLPASEVDANERKTLLAEAALCAERSVASASADPAKIAFAALLASSAGNAEAARRLFDRSLALAPNDAPNLLQAALSALGAGDGARAKELAARRRIAAADDAWNDGLDAQIALAAPDLSLSSEDAAKAAIDAARRAVAADSDRLEFRMLLARALRKGAKPADAARMLSALEPSARAKPAIAEQFALALAESNDLVGAARAWEDALRGNPADPYVRAQTALAFHRAGLDVRAASELDALMLMKGGAAERTRIDAIWSNQR